jgi:hypothetical protein
MHYNAPEWHIIVIACICSVIYGAAQPVPGILYGSVLGVSFSLDVTFEGKYKMYDILSCITINARKPAFQINDFSRLFSKSVRPHTAKVRNVRKVLDLEFEKSN